jgi:hypothetical protein
MFLMSFLGSRDMGLLELFTTACMPVLTMLLVTGVGSFLATDFAGILGKEARKHLNYVSGNDWRKKKGRRIRSPNQFGLELN